MKHVRPLILALILLIISASDFAQTVPEKVPNAKDTLLFDFESGNFDGWTLTGDCWDTHPATVKTFVDRQGNLLVSGIVGNGYLTTLFKSAATTGRAVSKDFTIDKPFLTFKIGGGHYPKEACLNLVVEGKIVRTETGNDSAELRPAYWDVYALVGKTAHLEIVDTTTNPKRGYIMVDDLRLTETLNTPEQQTMTRMAENWKRQFGLPGIWCACVKDGKIAACVAIGTRKIGEDYKPSVMDHLNIGSVSKVITGSMIAFFVADGTIKYETTVGEVFPEFAKKYPNSLLLGATLRQLLTHTSGLPRPVPPSTSNGDGKAYRYDVTEQTLKTLSNEMVAPGIRRLYSNNAPLIAVAMVERLSKKSYENWFYGDIGRSIGLRNPKMLDYQKEPVASDIFPHIITSGEVKIGNLIEITHRKLPDNSIYAVQGSCSLSLLDLCGFAHFTMTNSAHLPQTVYENIIRIPDDGSMLITNTNAGWGYKRGSGNIDHDGNTGRGEYCYVRVNPRTKSAFIFYINANFTNAEDFQRLTDAFGPEIVKFLK